NRNRLFELSQLEQTLSTGFDDADAEVKAPRLVLLVQKALTSYNLSKREKIRLLAIFIISQRGIAEGDRRTLIQAAGLNAQEQQVLLNFERLGVSLQQSKASTVRINSSMMSAVTDQPC